MFTMHWSLADLYYRGNFREPPDEHVAAWDYLEKHPQFAAAKADAIPFKEFGFSLLPLLPFAKHLYSDDKSFPLRLQTLIAEHKGKRQRANEGYWAELGRSFAKELVVYAKQRDFSRNTSLLDAYKLASDIGAQDLVLDTCSVKNLVGEKDPQLHRYARNCSIEQVTLPEPESRSQGIYLHDCKIGSIEHRPDVGKATSLNLRNLKVGLLHSDAADVRLENISTNLIRLTRIGTTRVDFKDVRVEHSWDAIERHMWGLDARPQSPRFYRDCSRWQRFWTVHWRPPASELQAAEINNNLTGIRSLRNTLEKLRADNAILISPGDYERLYHYLDSRESWPKRLLYSFVGAYYNIWAPLFVGVAAAILNYTLIPYFGAPAGKNPILFVANPKALLEEVLFPDFSLSLDVNVGRALLGVSILLVEILFGYSLFAFGLAIRRRFGFPKES